MPEGKPWSPADDLTKIINEGLQRETDLRIERLQLKARIDLALSHIAQIKKIKDYSLTDRERMELLMINIDTLEQVLKE